MNTPGYREIERKYRMLGTALQRKVFLKALQKRCTSPDKYLVAKTIDNYYAVPGKAQFLRLRHSWGMDGEGGRRSLKEVTVKQKDRGTNLNRLEINVGVASLREFRRVLGLTLGQPLRTLYKKEYVLWMDGGVVISLCYIKGKAWYLEIEAPRLSQVKEWEHTCIRLAHFVLEREDRSLFELYIGDTNG